jgi:hypothetical protein
MTAGNSAGQPKERSFPLNNVVDIGIDKMKFCLPRASVDTDFPADIEQRLKEAANGKRPYSAKGKPFGLRMPAIVAEETVLVECKPNKESYPYVFTAEFNPNKYFARGDAAIVSLARFFRYVLGHDAHRLLAGAVISRLDVNVDFSINILEGTLVEVKGKRGGANVMCNFDGTGTLGSLYIGALGSDHRLRVYDKAAEILRRELKSDAGKMLRALASPDDWPITVKKLREAAAAPVLWRMEVSCEPKPARPVSEIASFASCFDGIRFLHLPTDRKPYNDSMGRTFVSLARHVGIPTALRALDVADRRRFTSAISRLERVDWFSAEALQDFIKRSLDRLGPLFRPPALRAPIIERRPMASFRTLPAKQIITDVKAPTQEKVRRLADGDGIMRPNRR